MLAEHRKDFEIETLEPGDYNTKAYELYKNLKSITRKVRMHAEADFCYAQKYHDKNLKGPYFDVGDEVFVLIQCPKHKFGPRWTGPFKICRKINDHLYCLEMPNDERKNVNIGKLKKYMRNVYSPKAVIGTPEIKPTVIEPVVNKKPVIGDTDDSCSSSSEDEEDIRTTRKLRRQLPRNSRNRYG
jgi:hypothetical protein